MLILFLFLIKSTNVFAQEDAQYIKCNKNLLFSSAVGIKKGKDQGTALFKYVPTKYLCEVSDLEKDECFDRHQGLDLLERSDAVIGFDKSPRYPQDSNVTVLDLQSLEYYKTVKQDNLRYTLWGKCEHIAKPILQGKKQAWMIMELSDGRKTASPASDTEIVSLNQCKKNVKGVVKLLNATVPDGVESIKKITCVESVNNPLKK